MLNPTAVMYCMCRQVHQQINVLKKVSCSTESIIPVSTHSQHTEHQTQRFTAYHIEMYSQLGSSIAMGGHVPADAQPAPTVLGQGICTDPKIFGG